MEEARKLERQRMIHSVAYMTAIIVAMMIRVMNAIVAYKYVMPLADTKWWGIVISTTAMLVGQLVLDEIFVTMFGIWARCTDNEYVLDVWAHGKDRWKAMKIYPTVKWLDR